MKITHHCTSYFTKTVHTFEASESYRVDSQGEASVMLAGKGETKEQAYDALVQNALTAKRQLSELVEAAAGM